MIRIIALIAAALALSSCSEQSDADQVKEQAQGMIKDLRAGEIGDACDRTTDPSQCAADMALAREVVGDLGKFIPSSWERGFDEAKVTIVADLATLKVGGDDSEFFKRDGRWLLVWTDE